MALTSFRVAVPLCLNERSDMSEHRRCSCGSIDFVMVEYPYDHPAHYDGVSEHQCLRCGNRYGRWSGRKLNDNEVEQPFGGENESRHEGSE